MNDNKKNAKTAASNNRSVWVFWLPLGLAIIIFLTISFIGNVLIIGTKLGTFHYAIEWIFYGGLITLFLWLISVPLLSVLTAPMMTLEDITDETDSKKIIKIANQLIKSKVLEPAANAEEKQSSDSNAPENEDEWLKDLFTIGNEEKLKKAVSNNDELDKLKRLTLKKMKGAVGYGSNLRGPLSMAITLQKTSATKVIREHAALVFVSTAISQNGRLDAITVLVTNFRLVKSLVHHFAYRPPLPTLVKVYCQIFMAALIADAIDDIDVENLFGQSIASVLSAVPGGSIMAISVLDGIFNAMLTLRVGFVTRQYLLNVGSTLRREYIRKIANSEAGCELVSVCKDASRGLPKAVVTAFKIFT